MLRRILLGTAAVALLASGSWLGWRWYTTPVPPRVPLDDVNQETAEIVNKAMKRVGDQPRSGKAWAEMGLALKATGFAEQAVRCLAQAERLSIRSPRVPSP